MSSASRVDKAANPRTNPGSGLYADIYREQY